MQQQSEKCRLGKRFFGMRQLTLSDGSSSHSKVAWAAGSLL
jgi:hypothetical protein